LAPPVAGTVRHHAVVIEATGRCLLSRRIANSDGELIDTTLARAEAMTWAIDLAMVLQIS
jgi:hypothetical protein